jgi:hypothetical protein
MIETLGFPLEIKNLSDTGEIVGLASVYGNLDRQGEAVAAARLADDARAPGGPHLRGLDGL